MDLVRIRIDRHEVSVRSEDFDRCSDEIDIVGFIIVGISDFTPDYTV